MDNKRKQDIDDWFREEWKTQPATLRENARLLIVPDKLLRRNSANRTPGDKPDTLAVPRNPYTSSRLALMNEVAYAAGTAGCIADRQQALRMLAHAGFKDKGHRERAASIIVYGMERQKTPPVEVDLLSQ